MSTATIVPRWRPLEEVAPTASERVHPFTGERRYVATGGIDGGVITDSDMVTHSMRPTRADLAVRPGDVIWAKMRATTKVFHVGKEDASTIFSTGFVASRPRKDLVHSRYLYHFLRSPLFQHRKDQLCTGSTQKAITKTGQAKLQFPWLPLENQERAAAILDHAEAIESKKRLAIVLGTQLGDALFREAIASDAEDLEIGEMLQRGILMLHKDGNFGSAYPRARDFTDEGVPFLTAASVTDEGKLEERSVQRLREEKAQALRFGWIEKGDVLLSHNATVGRVLLYRGEYKRALIGTSLTAFRPDPKRLLPTFLFGALRSSRFQDALKAKMAQTTRNQVPITAQRRLRLPYAPMGAQVRYAECAKS